MKEQRYVRSVEGGGRRLFVLSIVAAATFFVLLSRLWYLQVIQTDRLKALSESNRLRFVPIAASRGAILDRNGKMLVDNAPSFSVAVIPQDVKDRDALIASLARDLKMDPAELRERWDKGRGRAKFYPVVLASGITRDQMEFLEENQLRLPGLEIEMKPVRLYPNGTLASHLLGYLGEISDDELELDQYRSYNPGDYVGKSGIERSWERYLHGADGGRQIEVDARGRFLRTISETSPTVGNSVVLTIDMNLQRRAEEAFGDKAGAAVLIDVKTGEILVFASNPGFDPALFTGRMPADKWREYLEDVRHPLEDKALKGQYPPGSTFKIITALAGLQSGLIDGRTTVDCTGSYKVGRDTFHCWDRKGHGIVNLRQALKESCDVYFYHLGDRLGVDRIATCARQFGFGTPLGIGLDNEKGGVMPTAEWKEKRYGKKWLRGETMPVAIGQGYVLATPVQLAAMIAGVANDGVMYRPHLVKRVVDPEGRVVKEFTPELLPRPAIDPSAYRLVKEGLFAVVNEPHGTGASARIYGVQVAGKTGTSQVVKLRDSRGNLPYKYRDHALFVAFAPYDKPEVAVAVVVEHGEHGGSAAAPIAAQILRTYFEEKGVIRPPKAASTEGKGDEGGGATPAAPPVAPVDEHRPVPAPGD